MKQIKIFSILMMLVLCCGTMFAQNATITGIITDANTSEPLLGASVVLKGTTQGTVSDMEITLSRRHRVPHWCSAISVMIPKK